MLDYCGREGFDLTLIETMPMGAIDKDRTDRVLPLTQVFDDLSRRFALTRDAHSPAGPARYWRGAPWDIRLVLNPPLTDTFCDGCNRVRLTTQDRTICLYGKRAHAGYPSG